MSQVIKMETYIQHNPFDSNYSQNYQNKTTRKNSIRKCTCETGEIKSWGKKSWRYSMCDVCSEKLFSEGLIN